MPVHRLACVSIALVALTLPASARAWTDAHVRTVQAHVEVQPDGRARVAMVLGVRIHAGWLEGLEIAGLEPDYVLDESKPPWAVSADDPDLKFEPRIRTRDGGRIQLSFRGRGNSPRSGMLHIGLVYTTDLAHRATEGLTDGKVRVRWTLPPWRSGLDGVSVALTVPAGAEQAPVEAGDGQGQISFRRVALSDRTVLTWERAHLPRTVPWTLEVDVPEEAMAAELRTSARRSHTKPRLVSHGVTPPDGRGPIALATILAALVILSRITFRRACRAAAATERPWLPSPAWLATPAVAGAAALAAWIWPEQPVGAVALLSLVAVASLQRTPRRDGPAPRFGSFRAATPLDLRRARRHRWWQRAGLSAPVDATTLAGVVLLPAACGSVWLAATHDGMSPPPMLLPALGLLVVPFLSATRMHVPTTAATRLALLEGISRRLGALPAETPACSYRLMVHVDARGEWQDARLRIHPSRPATQLLRLDLAVAERPELGGWAAHAALVSVTRSETAVEEALDRAMPEARRERAPGDRLARILPCDAHIARSLATVLSAVDRAVDEERRSSGAGARARRADPEAA